LARIAQIRGRKNAPDPASGSTSAASWSTVWAGRISVTSQRGHGAIFVVELPLARVAQSSGDLARAAS
jgi:hypothetical protein